MDCFIPELQRLCSSFHLRLSLPLLLYYIFSQHGVVFAMLMCCQINPFLVMTVFVKSWTKDHLDKASARAHHIVLVINKINYAGL